MEIVVRTGDGETVVRPETGSAAGASGAADAGSAKNAGAAPSSPGEGGLPPANVAATEPPRVATGADQSAGGAPQLG